MKGFAAFVVLGGIIIVLIAYAGGWITPPRQAFAESISRDLSGAVTVLGRAVDSQAVAIDTLTELNGRLVQANIERELAEIRLINTLRICLVIFVAILALLAAFVAWQVRKGSSNHAQE